MSEPTIPVLPPWWQRVEEAYASGESHFIILHGIGVTDLVAYAGSFNAYLEKMLALRLAEPLSGGAVWYARHSGFTFGGGPNAERWKNAFTLTLAEGMPAPPAIRGQPQQTAEQRASMLDLNSYRAPGAALPALDRVIRQKARTFAMVIEFPESLVPESTWASMSGEDRTSLETLLAWAQPEFADNGHLVLLVTRNLNDLHSALRAASAHILTVEVAYPDLREREAWVSRLVSQAREDRTDDEVLAMTPAEAARLSAGMGRLHIEDVFLAARQAAVPVDRERIAAHKRQVVKAEFGDVLEPWETTRGFEGIGGNQHVKEFFQRQLIDPIQRGDLRRVPKGVLMLGPPGTGKSMMAAAVANEAGMNAIKFDPSKVFDKWVGSTERNLKRALDALTTFEPALVFIDEIDQQGLNRGGGEGGNGVSDRVFGMLLEFLAREENRGRVCWLGASNRPDLLDAALKRPGRFDKKIVFGPPDPGDRATILAMHLATQLPGVGMHADGLRRYTDPLEWWTGAELEALAIKVGEVFHDETISPSADLTVAIPEALRLFRPSTRDIERQTLIALSEVNDLSLLPPAYREIAQQPLPEPTDDDAPARKRRML